MNHTDCAVCLQTAGFTFLAAGPGSSRRTDAAVTVNFIHAGGAEGAGRRLALVDV